MSSPIRITVRLFALMADRAGQREIPLSLRTSRPTVADALAVLHDLFPAIPWPTGTMLALNQSYTTAAAPLTDGDELAIIPPVSGG